MFRRTMYGRGVPSPLFACVELVQETKEGAEAQRVSVRATLGRFVRRYGWQGYRFRRSGAGGRGRDGKAKKFHRGERKQTPTPEKKFDFRFAARFAEPLYSPNTTDN